MIVLLDQDGPLADFEKGFLQEWKRKYPDKPHIPLSERSTFRVYQQYPDELKEEIKEIYHSPGFYRNLPPVSGAVGAVKEMVELGLDVRICTSPLSNYENCVLEKYQWVEEHLGREFTKRIFLAKDKTLVRGNVLIDDRPQITGSLDPVWEHVVFQYPFNRDTSKRSLDWTNWKQKLNL